MRLCVPIAAFSALIVPLSASAQDDSEPAPLVSLSETEAAAVFNSWAGRWSGAVRTYEAETGEPTEFPETIVITRTDDGVAMSWVAEGQTPDAPTPLVYAGGALVFDPGEDYESVEPIVEFQPPDAAGDWRIVTAYQDGPEDALYDVVEVYSMRFGRFLHEIASAPSGSEQLTVEMQAYYDRVGG